VFWVAKLTPGFVINTNVVSRIKMKIIEKKKGLFVYISFLWGLALLKAIAVTTYWKFDTRNKTVSS
jgi:hypothetical protein